MVSMDRAQRGDQLLIVFKAPYCLIAFKFGFKLILEVLQKGCHFVR
jgi:hypothetical protein